MTMMFLSMLLSQTIAVHYSDLFFLTLIPIIMQGAAILYLWKIHKYIGKEMTLLLGIINGLLLTYDIIISALLLQPPEPDELNEGIEFWGIFIGFAMPLGNAIAHLLLQIRLAKGLLPQ